MTKEIMKTISPKIEKIVRRQNIASVINTILGCWLTISVSNYYLSFTLGSILIALIAAQFVVRSLNWITLMYFQFREYGADVVSLEKDTRMAVIAAGVVTTPALATSDFTIVAQPETPLGSFMGTPFFDWIDVKLGDEITHLTFYGTMDVSSGETDNIPAGSVLLPPGIIYQVDTSVNTST